MVSIDRSAGRAPTANNALMTIDPSRSSEPPTSPKDIRITGPKV
jgi:hypothetical protein